MKVEEQFVKECEAAVRQTLAVLGAPADLPLVKEIPDNADLAIPCFTLSKVLRKPPVVIAEEIAKQIKTPSGVIAGLTAVNGYLNFTVDSRALVGDTLTEITQKGKDFGQQPATGRRVNVEHTSTNPTGPIHVGRARNPIIGDTLARCIRRNGDEVTTEYYVNDVGKQVVMMAWGVAHVTPAEVKQEIEESGKEDDRDKVDHRLVYNYRVATKKIHNDPAMEEQIAEMVRKFEAGDQTTIDQVKQVAETMLGGLKETLANMNVALDRYTWESAFIANGDAKHIVERLKATKYAGTADDGASYLNLKDFGIHGKNTNFTFTRADGTTLYTTRDLAYHLDKFSRSDRVIDVLGEDQKLGSQQLCAALQIMGVEQKPEPLFYAFVSLPEGRMSTRAGVVVYLDDLIDEATDRAYEEIKKRRVGSDAVSDDPNMPLRESLSEEKMRAIAHDIGVGAVRYSIVRVSPDKQFVFKWEDALNFDGNSGPYLQYVHARACSIMRKAGAFEVDTDASKLTDEYEIALAKKLAQFESVLKEVAESKRVNQLPNYGHEVAAAFNQFYAVVPVLKDGPSRNARLTLVMCAKTVMANVLDCLGMAAPEEM